MIPWRNAGTRRSWGGKHEVPWFLSRLGSADAGSFERLARILLRLALSPPDRRLAEGDFLSTEGGYLAAAGESAMPVFVQLAAFPERAEDLGAPQVLHCRAAQERFARGPVQAEVYLLVTNRDPRSPAFRAGLAQELAALEAGGRVAHALAWDPRDLVEAALDSLFDLTLAAARRGLLSVAPVESAMAGTPDLVTEVPLQVSWLTADQHRLGPDEDPGHETVADPAALLQEGTSSVRTLLLGGFGFGKTTAVARSLLREDLRLLYVPGASLTHEIGTAKVFLSRCINAEPLFGDAPADERVLYERMLRAVAEHLFKDETLPCALVIDGLDESPFLCRGAGLQHLLNNLETVRIPVILAMRSEYWRSRRGDLTSTAGRLESRGEPRVRRIRKLELLPWREDEILVFIRRFREACADTAEQERLGALVSLVEDGGYADVYGDIPRRPLFLRLIAESAAALGLPGRRIGRARLFRDWALWKIHRDLRVGRPHLIFPGEPVVEVQETAWEAMLRAATCMTREHEGELEILPDCSFERVRRSTPRLEKLADVLALSLQSLLQLSTERTGPRRPRVAFAHRAFQEFFLAWFLAEGSLGHQWILPLSVREWIEDLRREELLDPEGAEEAERTPGLPPAPQRPVLWSPPDSLPSASRAPAAEPADLILHVLERPGGRRRLFELRLTAREPDLGLRDRSFGTIELQTEPLEFFRRHLKEATGSNALRTWGAFFSERILPADLRKKLSALRHKVRLLQIVSDETFIPWEILRLEETPESREVDGPFLAEAFALTRWLYGIRQTSYLPLSQIAAVVPETSELPHAGPEWDDLRRLAGEGRQVERIPARLQDLVSAFESGRYDGWHFTGHGLFRGSSPDLSVLSLDGKETLTPPHLSGAAKRMGVKRPLVFLNACEASQVGLSLTDLGGWVPGFLRAGAGGFIGSLWEIGDSRSRTFAHVFYTSFLAGLPLADAVQEAREAIRSDDDPTWLAYTVFGHPRAVCRPVPVGVPATEAEPEPPRRPDPIERLPPATPLAHEVISSSDLIRRKREGFVGRKWVFAAVDRFLVEQPRGYFTVTGDPGIGKSALMAELVHTRGWVHHFTIRGDAASRTDRFLANVCAQLIERYGLPYSSLPARATEDNEFLKSLLREVAGRLAPGERVVIVVDALDEADLRPGLAGNVLSLPSTLPDRIYFVLTRRRDELPLRFEDPEQEILDLDQHDERNVDDIHDFLRMRIKQSPSIRRYIKRQGLSEDEFREVLSERSQGNFMYLFYVLPELERERGSYRQLGLDRLPVGLSEYYKDHWRRMEPTLETSCVLPVLEVLAVAVEPISAQLLGYLAEIQEIRKVRSVLRKWPAFLYEMPGLPGEGRRYRLYHRSFGEFLEQKLELQETHARIANLLWGELFGETPG